MTRSALLFLPVAGLVLVFLAGAAEAQPLFSEAQDPLAGSRVFGAKGCVRCHAVRGVGGKVGPDLGRLERARSFYDLGAALWNHAPRMAERMRQLGIARPRLDAREAGDLAAFLFTLDYFDRPGDATAGRRLFAAKRCIACHQVGGAGGVVGPSLDAIPQFASPIYLAAAMWNHSPQMVEVMRARGIARPTFKDGELLDLIAFIRASSPVLPQGALVVLPGRAAEGQVLFARKRCLDCHGAGGRGGTLGPDLAQRSAGRSVTAFAAAMWNKAPAMQDAMRARGVPVPQIQPEEMADIVAYLYAVRYFAEAGDPRRGAVVAAAKGCLGCHPAPDLGRAPGLGTPAGVLSALWNHSFLEDRARARATWAELSAAEMADLVAYLQALPRTR